MPDYTVSYAIDVFDQESPEAAAQWLADKLANEGYAERGVYEVSEHGTTTTIEVDLDRSNEW
jgi:hypothetical protein